jgi:general bacterial porin, GBP family
MKKTLLAAALLAGFAGAASAQSSVTLYGIVDVGILSQTLKTGDNDPRGNQTANQTGMASGQQSGSRWGLKGVEDLGNGLSANFVYESSVSVNSGASSGFTRQSTLGLVGKSWGSIDLGRRTTPGTVAFAGIDPFGNGFGTAALDSSMGATFSRLSNLVMYTSPSMNGFMGSIGYSFDSGASTAGIPTSANYADKTSRYGSMTKTRALSIGLRYANGPLVIAGMYDQYMPAAYKTTTASAADFTDAATVKQWNLGATYDFKVAKLHAAYGQNIDGLIEGSNVINNFTDGGDTNSAGGVLSYKGARTSSWMLGVSAPVGAAGSVFASWQQMMPGGDFKDAAFTSTQNVGSIGYTYNMSKRTNLYAYYSYMSNAGMLTGAQSNSLGVGVRHKF